MPLYLLSTFYEKEPFPLFGEEECEKKGWASSHQERFPGRCSKTAEM